MKKIYLFLLSAAITALVVSCNNKNNGGGDPNGGIPAGYATTPQACNLNTPGCVPQNYQNLNYNGMNWGGTLFPNQWNPGVGNCGCVPFNGMQYNPFLFPNVASIGCVPANAFQGFTQYVNMNAYWSAGGQINYNSNLQTANVQQIPFPTQYGGPSGACMQQIGPGCILSQQMNGLGSGCAAGRVCRPAATGASSIGICLPY